MKRRRFVVLLSSAIPAGVALGMASPAMHSRSRAIRYLVGRQSEDGGWRSKVYGAFKSGHGLTPLVLRATYRGGSASSEAGVSWLKAQGAKTCGMFPVHNASWLLELAEMDERLAPLAGPLTEHLRGLQLGSERRWEEGSLWHGGWSYSGSAPVRREGLELAPMQQPNLSATVLAVAGLRAGGVGKDDPAMREAARFISSCQNDVERGPRGKFDDGGFFQMPEDGSRNKAGVAGTDGEGRKRFRSYYSATADGVRGLLECGVAMDDARVRAGLGWLRENPGLEDVPDLICYAAWSRSRLRSLLESRESGGRPSDEGPARVAGGPGVTLPQSQDGSYANPSGEMRENDPLVATSLLAMAE